MTNRNSSDEALLEAIAKLSPSEQSQTRLLIYDARPYLNALVNRVTSGGYENSRDYRDCEIVFCDIDNIHAVSGAFAKLHELGASNTPQQKWFSQLENTNWLQLLSRILLAVNNMLETITVKEVNVLVHCTDGWDRTA